MKTSSVRGLRKQDLLISPHDSFTFSVKSSIWKLGICHWSQRKNLYTISENQNNKDGVYKLDFKCYDKDNVLVDSFTTINLVSNKYEIKPDVNNNSYSYVLDIIERGEDGDNVIKTPNLMGSNILFGLELSGQQEKIYKEIVRTRRIWHK